MRNVIAAVKNIRHLAEAGDALRQRAQGIPGIGLIWGPAGFGKTTAAHWYAVRHHAIHLRAVATWTPTSMLAALMRELNAEPMLRGANMLTFIADALILQPRPIFIDEADYLLSKKLVETLRDLHDLSGAPLFLIGMAEFRRRVIHRAQLADRIAQWVEFHPSSIEDAQTLAVSVCEVSVADDLLECLHTRTRGSMRGMVNGLSRIEGFARRAGKDMVRLCDWGNRPFTFANAME